MCITKPPFAFMLKGFDENSENKPYSEMSIKEKIKDIFLFILALLLIIPYGIFALITGKRYK